MKEEHQRFKRNLQKTLNPMKSSGERTLFMTVLQKSKGSEGSYIVLARFLKIKAKKLA